METPTVVETSSQADLQVTPPVTSAPDTGSDTDWASRLDAAMDQINKDTGATKYGKVDDGEKTRSEKQAENNDAVTEKETKKSVKKAAKVVKAEEPETTETPEDASTEETKTEDSEETPTEETPKGLTEKAAVKWGELRNENRAYKKQLEELKSEIEKLKTTPPADNSELDRLKQINEEYEKELAVSRVEATAEYKQNVYEPMVNVMGFVNDLSTRYELNSSDMLAAFAESDPAKQNELVSDIASNMNERDRLKFYAAADDYNEIIRRRDYYQSTSRDRMAQIEQQRQSEIANQQAQSEKTVAEAKAAYEKASEKVFNDLKKSVPVLSDEEVAADVKRLAKGDYSSAPADLKAYLAHSGAVLPHILKALQAAKADLDKANKTIAGYRNGSPKAGSGSSDTSRDVPEDVGFLEALEQHLG
jgi:hypothetical protein